MSRQYLLSKRVKCFKQRVTLSPTISRRLNKEAVALANKRERQSKL